MSEITVLHRIAPVIATVCLLAAACGGSSGHAGSSTTSSSRPSGDATNVTFPRSSIDWPRPANQAAAISAADLPPLPAEGTVEHYHAHLDVVIDGKSVTVPGGLGIDVTGPKFSPLHTHDTTGIIHIESATHTQYTLGELFTEWNVRLTPACVGDFCNGTDRQMIVAVNNQAFTGDPATIVLATHQEIVIWSASPGTPPNLPSTYTFPQGH
jgi:hypothetical protein